MGTACATEKASKHRAKEPSSDGKTTDQLRRMSMEESPIIIIKKQRPKPQSFVTSVEDIRRVYDLGPTIIGYGHYGVVRLGVLRKDSSKRFAVKTISKQKLRKDIHLFTKELEILKSLDHPNVIKFFETYSDTKHYHLVMEYCSGGELLEMMGDASMTEEQKKAIMRKIILVVKYLHSQGVIHRDIKPENFLLTRDSPHSHELKIIDFGLSTHFSVLDRQGYSDNIEGHRHYVAATTEPNLSTICGTPLYIAPEVIKGKYDHRCDIWSIGILLYAFLVGQMPFEGQTNAEIFEKIVSFNLTFGDKKLWANVSPAAQDFLKRFLVNNPEDRITLDEALSHPWLQNAKNNLNTSVNNSESFAGGQQLPRLNEDVVQKMFLISNEPICFRKMAVRVLVNFIEEEEVFAYKELFRMLNTENTGVLSAAELKAALGHNSNMYASSDNRMKSITYSEFLAAMLESKLLEKQRLRRVFKHFDVDDTDYISTINLQRFLARAGRSHTHSCLVQIMQSAIDSGAQIDGEDDDDSNNKRRTNDETGFTNYRITWRTFCGLIAMTNRPSVLVKNQKQNENNRKQSQVNRTTTLSRTSSFSMDEGEYNEHVQTNIGTPSLTARQTKFSFDHLNTATTTQLGGQPYFLSTPKQENLIVSQQESPITLNESLRVGQIIKLQQQDQHLRVLSIAELEDCEGISEEQRISGFISSAVDWKRVAYGIDTITKLNNLAIRDSQQAQLF